MRDKADLVRGWLRKAESDRLAMEASLEAGALDAACFHAQQAVEKNLKAYLIFAGKNFPHTHNLAKLVEICVQADPSFGSLLPLVEPLTPYAVELRYDDEFWPTIQTAQEASASAQRVRQLVRQKLPDALLATLLESFRQGDQTA